MSMAYVICCTHTSTSQTIKYSTNYCYASNPFWQTFSVLRFRQRMNFSSFRGCDIAALSFKINF